MVRGSAACSASTASSHSVKFAHREFTCHECIPQRSAASPCLISPPDLGALLVGDLWSLSCPSAGGETKDSWVDRAHGILGCRGGLRLNNSQRPVDGVARLRPNSRKIPWRGVNRRDLRRPSRPAWRPAGAPQVRCDARRWATSSRRALLFSPAGARL